jgi:hypothetical protein
MRAWMAAASADETGISTIGPFRGPLHLVRPQACWARWTSSPGTLCPEGKAGGSQRTLPRPGRRRPLAGASAAC